MCPRRSEGGRQEHAIESGPLVSQMASPSCFTGRVLVVEDEPYLRLLLVDALRSRGIDAQGASDAASALEHVRLHDPHVVIADLDLGPGPSGADLLNALHRDHPWLGLIVLTGHADPLLALPANSRLPPGCPYLVKSELSDFERILAALNDSLAEQQRSRTWLTGQGPGRADEPSTVYLTAAQGEVLRLIALGLSNDAVAAERGTTRRAAEMQVQRVFAALGVAHEEGRNARVLAARMWRDGRIAIR
jgi:DNA-binding NarL/FixJ family response regulator